MLVKFKLKIFAGLLGLIVLSGCAVTNYTIERKYTPQLNKLANTEHYSILTKVNYTPVFVNDIKAVGVDKGGFNEETGKIYLNERAEDWIMNAFQQELVKAGYSVNDENAKNQVVITLNVKQLFVEPWVGAWIATLYGKLAIETKVEILGSNKYYIRKFVYYDEASTIAWPPGLLEDRIINVTEKSLPNIIREINILLTNKVRGK